MSEVFHGRVEENRFFFLTGPLAHDNVTITLSQPVFEYVKAVIAARYYRSKPDRDMSHLASQQIDDSLLIHQVKPEMIQRDIAIGEYVRRVKEARKAKKTKNVKEEK